MKSIFLGIALIVFVVLAGDGFAQNKVMSVTPTPSKPLNSVTASGHRSATTSPNAHMVNLEVRAQMKKIQNNFSLGKITKDQAKVAFANLRAVRQEELKFFHQNGQMEITLDQKNRIEKSLSQNVGAI